MKYAIVSDLHANLTAFKAVLEDAGAQGVESVVCLGDVVGYGPEPAETLRLVRRVAAESLAGNHDDAVTGRLDDTTFIDLAHDAVLRHREALSGEERDWLANRPYSITLPEGACAVHGDFIDPPAFNYIESESDAAANFAWTKEQLLFAGHTHVPCIFLVGGSGRVYRTEPQDFTLEDGKRYIVNPGSVGYPREADGKCLSSYVIYDSTERTVTYRFIAFSVASVMQRGRGGRPFMRRAAAFLALVALLLVIGFGVALTRFTGREPPVPPPISLTVETRELGLGPNLTVVRPMLELEPGSPPVNLELRYRLASGEIVHATTEMVSGRKTKKYKVRKDAVAAEFTVKRIMPADKPAIRSFRPYASAD